MKLGKVQGFLQGFLRACKKDFDRKFSDTGSWDQFIKSLCQTYADGSDNPELNRLASIAQEVNVAFSTIPVKHLKKD